MAKKDKESVDTLLNEEKVINEQSEILTEDKKVEKKDQEDEDKLTELKTPKKKKSDSKTEDTDESTDQTYNHFGGFAQ